MTEPKKITIIEGPPPTFEYAHENWLFGLTEGPSPYRIARCQLRTFNGPALVERCYRAWRDNEIIELEFRSEDGLKQKAPIVAARWMEMDQGDVLMLWVRLEDSEVEIELDFEFDDDEDDDFDGPFWEPPESWG
ncbi:MAG: hypothetical protein ACLFWD_04430 [Anaerolineales bacterium]